ncbi:hypothetical protein GF327_06135 [Candidatus Woesearchaeota archaeon]|nr:hypothetical protein [Candidatus Woesearchaeota archaeon]
MANDDYELLPHEEIRRLKNEISKLKSSPEKKSDDLVNSMDSLGKSISSLLGVFKEAAEEMKLDEHDSMMLSDKIDPLIRKIDLVLDQNEKIAKGIVAIADMVEEMQASSGTKRNYQSPPPQKQTPPKGPQAPVPPKFNNPPQRTQHKPLPSMNNPPTDKKQDKKDKKPFFKIKF